MDLKFLKKEKKFKKEGGWLDLNIFWEITIFSLFIIAIVSFICGYILFMQIDKDFKLTTDVPTGQTQAVKKENIDKVLDLFKTKEDKSNKIISSPVSVVDPSL